MSNVIEEIKENIEEGLEDLEEIVEETIEEVEDKPKKTTKKITKKKGTKTSKKDNSKDIKKEAEAESKEENKDLEKKKAEILKKAQKLKEKLSEEAPKTEELKEKVKLKKRAEMLLPLEEYVKSGIYIGTKVVTPNMKPFVYRRRADGLAIFNTDLIDEKIKEGIEYLSKFNSEDVIVICKRQAGWDVVEMFSKLTGIRAFTKKYPAGILTNTALPDFFENKLTIITDHWLDKNALNDTLNVNKKVLMVCDTNNFSKGADMVMIGNNKSAKSLGLIFYLLTRGYMKAKGLDTSKIPELEWWTGEIKSVGKSAEFGV